MLFYIAVVTHDSWVKIVCCVLIAALSPQLTHFLFKFGKDGIEFIKSKLAAKFPEGGT